MKREVVFLMSGNAHVPYLAVSLMTLREHWHGRVRVFAWPESIDLVRKIAEDERLDITAELSEPAYRAKRDEGRQGKNDQFIHKIKLVQSITDADLVLYLDADTSIHGDLMPLFRVARAHRFVAPRFSSWTTAGGAVRARIERLRKFPAINQDCVEEVLRLPWPSVNGGVFCCSPRSCVLKTWEQWTWEARHVFIADEAVLHVLQPLFVPSGQMAVWPDGRFNCSCNPKWMPEKMGEHEVVVWHYHGDSAVRSDKHGGNAYRRWWPLWQRCLAENIGGCQAWAPREGNGWLGNKWMATLSLEGNSSNG